MPLHHASSGNLDRRGFGDVDTLTVDEYRARSCWGRLRYRLYRHPLVMFGIGPAYLFFLQHRLPVGLMRGGWRPWAEHHGDQPGDRAWSPPALIWLIGIEAFLLVHLPIMLLAASIGVWLFYVQHQFERTILGRATTNWTLHEAALHGSSHYDLPGVPALVHGQYRHAPCASSEQPHSRTTGCRACCAIIPSCAMSAG